MISLNGSVSRLGWVQVVGWHFSKLLGTEGLSEEGLIGLLTVNNFD